MTATTTAAGGQPWSDRTGSVSGWVLRGVRPLGGPPVDLVLAAPDGDRPGVVTAVTAPGRAPVPPGARVLDDRGLDGRGLVALPGLVDLHTHLREPGREDAETVESGSRSAALGGFVAVFAMANTDPVTDTAGVAEQVWRLGRDAGWCHVQPVGAVTVGLAGRRLAELGALSDSAAAVRVFSDDGHCVSDPLLMRRALEYVRAFDGVIAQHAQDDRLTEGAQMHEGEVSARLGLTGWPAVAEEAVIARDVLLGAHTRSRLHVCHVSTAGSAAIIRLAKERGIGVTAEVTPHHLLLTDDLAEGYDPVFKVNPPLRTAADVAALRAAVADGTIDAIATDHAPHPVEAKDCEWDAAAMGMLGLQTAVAVVQQALVDTGLLDWAGVADRMSVRPARIGRLGGYGRPLAVGEPAHVTLYDPSAPWTVVAAELASRSRNTPFAGHRLPGRVRATFHGGRPTVLDGVAVGSDQLPGAGGVSR